MKEIRDVERGIEKGCGKTILRGARVEASKSGGTEGSGQWRSCVVEEAGGVGFRSQGGWKWGRVEKYGGCETDIPTHLIGKGTLEMQKVRGKKLMRRENLAEEKGKWKTGRSS